MARVIILRLEDFASLRRHYYLRNDSDHEVAAFTVTRDYMPEVPLFEGKPVVSFEELSSTITRRTTSGFSLPCRHGG